MGPQAFSSPAGSAPPIAGRISTVLLVSRPGDVDDTAGRVYDRLVARYGYPLVARDLFRQASELPPEPAARAFLEARLDQTAALVVIIGPRWLDGLARPHDIVRVQIEAALRRQAPIIPTLAEGATMPTAAQLPPDLAPLALFNAAQARLDPDFDADIARLLETVARYAPSLPVQPTRAAALDMAASNTPGAGPARQGRPWLFRSPLRIASGALVSAALLFLLIAVIVTLAAGGAVPARALNATPPPTATYLATPSAPGTYYAPLTDGMPDWDTRSPCKPEPDGLHIAKSNTGCAAPDAASADDGDLSVQARQISGPLGASHGVYFRAAFMIATFYAFIITANGYWAVYREVDKSVTTLSTWRYTSAIHTGLGATNTIEARFKGAHLTFLVNGRQLGSITDSAIPAQGTASDPADNTGDGLFGMTGIEVVYTNFRLKPVS